MKTKIFIPIFAVLLLMGCSNDDNKVPNEESPHWSWAYFEFVKSDGTLFEEGEIDFRDVIINNVGDTIYSEWMPMPYSQDVFPELPQYNGLFGPVIVAESDTQSLDEGEEWNKTAEYWFKYAGSDDIDVLKIKDVGLHPEYRQIEFYINDEPFEPFAELYGSIFFLEIVKEQP